MENLNSPAKAGSQRKEEPGCAADAQAPPGPATAQPGDYFLLIDEGAAFYREVLNPEPDERALFDLDRPPGFRLTCCYSAASPEGEIVALPVARLTRRLSRQEFDAAYAALWPESFPADPLPDGEPAAAPSCPHCGAEVAFDDRACPECGGTVYGNF
jgi:hypothetical protein